MRTIFKSFKYLWLFMPKRERVTFIMIFILAITSSITQVFAALLPALIISRFTGESIRFLGFLSFGGLSNSWFIFMVCMIVVVLWFIRMLHYRMIDIFARKMMCVVNEKSQEIILLERKNLDFGMTTGEASYIIKSAVDCIYNLVEPFCYYFATNVISTIFLLVQLFAVDVYVGLGATGLVLILLTCVVARTMYQEKTERKIENTNAKINNHFLMSLTNLPLITMLNSKHRELQELKRLNNSFYKFNKKRANICFVYWVVVMSIEYLGLGALVIIYTSATSAATVIASITIIIEEILNIYTMIENWGYLISDIASAGIKFCNLQKIYPASQRVATDSQGVLAVEDVLAGDRITQIDIQDMVVKIGKFEKSYSASFVAGRCYILRGQSGTGKTTMVNALCGLREHHLGKIIINQSLEVPSLYAYKSHISYLFQDTILFDRSFEENVAYPDKKMNEKALELVSAFGLSYLLERKKRNDDYKSSLSGGEEKRINIIRAVSKDKDIYFLDEPTNELDDANVQIVMEVIRELVDENKIVLIISHDDRLYQIADQSLEL